MFPHRMTQSPVTDFNYVTGGDPYFSHERVIDNGGYGEVHQVVFPFT